MDRRKTLKLLVTGAVAVPSVLAGCSPADNKEKIEEPTFALDRNPDEIENEKRILAMDKFFTADEMATIAILSDIIIPADGTSGSATDAKVPEFIEFIVKDMPHHQTPLRGGLRWLDVQCLNRYNKAFKDCSKSQQIELIDQIAYPKKANPAMATGVSFFNKMRDLVASGFYTSEIGVKDIGYMGNKPNQWNGVPDDVLKQYNLAYTEKELKECISFDTK